MKSALTLLQGILLSGGLYAQSDQQAIQEWQHLHPHTLLISSERFRQLSADELQLLGEDYIIFNGMISREQLQQFNTAAVSVAASDNPVQDKDNSLYVKQWLADHPHVMLVKQSEFQAMDEAKQQECTNNPTILVLQGEVLTAEDLYDYEH